MFSSLRKYVFSLGCEKWLMKNVDDILSKIKRDTPKGKVATKKPSSRNSVCTVCNNAHTNDMTKCHTCNAWIHTECDIDKILEDEAERRKYICPPCRQSSHQKADQVDMKSKADTTIHTRATARKETESQTNLKDNRKLSDNNLNHTFIVNTDSQSQNAVANKSLSSEDLTITGDTSVEDVCTTNMKLHIF